MSQGSPSFQEWGEIYVSSALVISLSLLSGAICLLSGLVIGLYSVITDIPSTDLPTATSQATGCFLTVIFMAVGGGLMAIGAELWKKMG